MAYRILVIDDDPMIRHIVVSILSSEGHEVLAAEHGEAAVAILANEPRPININVIFCDVMMPGLSGLDLLTRLKLNADTQKIPIIMLTAESRTDDLMAGYEVGADYYITKPFTRQQLLYGLELVFEG